MISLSDTLSSVASLFFPRTCAVCRTPLSSGEKCLCINCLQDVPLTRYHRMPFNTVEQLFAGKIPIVRATGLMYYSKNNPYDKILYNIKYHNAPQLAHFMAQTFSIELLNDGFFNGIDLIVPIPLHRFKHASRGYNQSYKVAQGIAATTGIPLVPAIFARRQHASQTRKGSYERWLNTRNIFTLNPRYTHLLQGKHILVVDDVITTGATIESAIGEMNSIPGTQFSVLTLAVAHLW